MTRCSTSASSGTLGVTHIVPVRCRRHDKLALDLRTQLGGMDGRLVSAEGLAAGQLGAVDALQMQVQMVLCLC